MSTSSLARNSKRSGNSSPKMPARWCSLCCMLSYLLVCFPFCERKKHIKISHELAAVRHTTHMLLDLHIRVQRTQRFTLCSTDRLCSIVPDNRLDNERGELLLSRNSWRTRRQHESSETTSEETRWLQAHNNGIYTWSIGGILTQFHHYYTFFNKRICIRTYINGTFFPIFRQYFISVFAISVVNSFKQKKVKKTWKKLLTVIQLPYSIENVRNKTRV